MSGLPRRNKVKWTKEEQRRAEMLAEFVDIQNAKYWGVVGLVVFLILALFIGNLMT